MHLLNCYTLGGSLRKEDTTGPRLFMQHKHYFQNLGSQWVFFCIQGLGKVGSWVAKLSWFMIVVVRFFQVVMLLKPYRSIKLQWYSFTIAADTYSLELKQFQWWRYHEDELLVHECDILEPWALGALTCTRKLSKKALVTNILFS